MIIKLGSVSTTGDPEGKISVFSDDHPSREQLLEGLIGKYVGQVEQVPPAYSAIKVHGQRAYALARAGKPVILPSRLITIHSLTVQSYRYPTARLIVASSNWDLYSNPC